MCSHKGAFRIATNLRLQTMEHIVKLPLGVCRKFRQRQAAQNRQRIQCRHRNLSGASASDRANAIATPAAFWSCCWCLTGGWDFEPRSSCVGLPDYDDDDWTAYAGKNEGIPNALDDMSNEAVGIVGIPVVKTFGQTIFSFKKFKDSIDRYKVWVIAYTKQLRAP